MRAHVFSAITVAGSIEDEVAGNGERVVSLDKQRKQQETAPESKGHQDTPKTKAHNKDTHKRIKRKKKKEERKSRRRCIKPNDGKKIGIYIKAVPHLEENCR